MPVETCFRLVKPPCPILEKIANFLRLTAVLTTLHGVYGVRLVVFPSHHALFR